MRRTFTAEYLVIVCPPTSVQHVHQELNDLLISIFVISRPCATTTVKLQYNGIAPSAAKRPVHWSLPPFLDHFYVYNKKPSAAKRTVYWIWPLFLEDGKLEFDCTKIPNIIYKSYIVTHLFGQRICKKECFPF